MSLDATWRRVRFILKHRSAWGLPMGVALVGVLGVTGFQSWTIHQRANAKLNQIRAESFRLEFEDGQNDARLKLAEALYRDLSQEWLLAARVSDSSGRAEWIAPIGVSETDVSAWRQFLVPVYQRRSLAESHVTGQAPARELVVDAYPLVGWNGAPLLLLSGAISKSESPWESGAWMVLGLPLLAGGLASGWSYGRTKEELVAACYREALQQVEDAANAVKDGAAVTPGQFELSGPLVHRMVILGLHPETFQGVFEHLFRAKRNHMANAMYRLKNELQILDAGQLVVNDVQRVSRRVDSVQRQEVERLRSSQVSRAMVHEAANQVRPNQIRMNRDAIPEELRHHLDEVEAMVTQGQRALVERLRATLTPVEIREPTSRPLSDVFDALRGLQPLLVSERLTLSTHLPPALAAVEVMVDDFGLERVLVELIRNSSKAIRRMNRELDGERVKGAVHLEAKEEDDAVVLVFSDNGPGLKEEPPVVAPGRGHGHHIMDVSVAYWGASLEWGTPDGPLPGAHRAIRFPRNTQVREVQS